MSNKGSWGMVFMRRGAAVTFDLQNQTTSPFYPRLFLYIFEKIISQCVPEGLCLLFWYHERSNYTEMDPGRKEGRKNESNLLDVASVPTDPAYKSIKLIGLNVILIHFYCVTATHCWTVTGQQRFYVNLVAQIEGDFCTLFPAAATTVQEFLWLLVMSADSRGFSLPWSQMLKCRNPDGLTVNTDSNPFCLQHKTFDLNGSIVFSTVHPITLDRMCQQKSWRCTTLILSVTSETGEWIEIAAQLVVQIAGKSGAVGGFQSQNRTWESQELFCFFIHLNFQLLWFYYFVSDSFALILWKPDIRTSTVRPQEPWCCWLRCMFVTR